MIDLSFRSPRHVPSELSLLTQNRHRRLLPPPNSSMFVSASPLGSSNTIRTIQTRKPRITLQAYYDFTDIRSINLNNTSGITSSSSNFAALNPEKLVERSQDLRLGRLNGVRANLRPSVLSSTSTLNQQSLLWPSYNSPALTPTRNRSPTGHMPDIHQRQSRALSHSRAAQIEQQTSLLPAEPRHKSLSRTKVVMPKAYPRTISKSKSPYPTSRSQAAPLLAKDTTKPMKTTPIRMYESEDDDEDGSPVTAVVAATTEILPPVDPEYEDYLEKAMTKCADWLIKYVFDQKYEDVEEI